MELQLFINEYSDINKDLNKLHESIYTFNVTHNDDPYIVCSRETCSLIEAISSNEMYYEINNDIHNGKVGMYCGYKILTDNTLPFGKVKLR